MNRVLQTTSDIWVLTQRNLIRYLRLPQLLVFNAVLNVVLLLLFNYVFGGAIQTSRESYIQYFLPGFLAQIVVFGSTQTSVGIAEDFTKGFIDRFRSLPMVRPAFLTGRVIADALRYLLLLLLLVAVGLIMGFRFHSGAPQVLFALALIVLFGIALTWVGVYIGVSVKSVETAQIAGFVWVFPLVFASSLYVPIATMPGWLQAFAKVNPLTPMADLTRSLMLGGGIADSLWKILAWDVSLILLFTFLAFRKYNRLS
jgi:ABC transporter DrrB family efflux protein